MDLRHHRVQSGLGHWLHVLESGLSQQSQDRGHRDRKTEYPGGCTNTVCCKHSSKESLCTFQKQGLYETGVAGTHKEITIEWPKEAQEFQIRTEICQESQRDSFSHYRRHKNTLPFTSPDALNSG